MTNEHSASLVSLIGNELLEPIYSVQIDGEIISSKPQSIRMRSVPYLLFFFGLVCILHAMIVLLDPSPFRSVQVAKAYISMPTGIVVVLFSMGALRSGWG